MSARRFTRLTNAFSKKLEDHAHMVAIHFIYYDFCWKHRTIKTAPAVAVGVTDQYLESVRGRTADRRLNAEAGAARPLSSPSP